MRWRLLSDWPLPRCVIPAGTIIDSADMQWNAFAWKLPPPLCAMSLDQQSHDYMVASYPGLTHLLQYDPTTVTPKAAR